ncbi:hypothetical protein [Streptomyces sp. NPDC018693]|uniref:hypothetical protein n=1 Tax=unclassified Streptomyces TaxID=2593676 RepID=UPI0037B1D0EF
MNHITRRAVRAALGSAAVIAALALPLTLGASAASAADGEPQLPKAEKPIEETGSWVWDKNEP